MIGLSSTSSEGNRAVNLGILKLLGSVKGIQLLIFIKMFHTEGGNRGSASIFPQHNLYFPKADIQLPGVFFSSPKQTLGTFALFSLTPTVLTVCGYQWQAPGIWTDKVWCTER